MNIGIWISFLRSTPGTTTVGVSSTIAGGSFIRFFVAGVLFVRVVLSHGWEQGLRWAVSQFLLVADDLSRKTTKTCLLVCHLVLLVAESWDVKVRAEWINSSFWEKMEPACQGCSFIILCMIIGAVDLLTSRTMFALFSLKKFRVVLLLFPSMRITTLILLRTSIGVWGDDFVGLPILTHFVWVAVKWRLPPIILPVMSINASLTVMVIFPVWTPHCFEMKQIKIHIDHILLNQLHRNFTLIVSKWAKF